MQNPSVETAIDQRAPARSRPRSDEERRVPTAPWLPELAARHAPQNAKKGPAQLEKPAFRG
jgi:hypothetical protein